MKLKKKVQTNYIKVGIVKNEDKNIVFPFFKCLLNFRAYALQSELNKFSISNFVKF